jgi:hypothetical protein
MIEVVDCSWNAYIERENYWTKRRLQQMSDTALRKYADRYFGNGVVYYHDDNAKDWLYGPDPSRILDWKALGREELVELLYSFEEEHPYPKEED